MQDTRSGQLPMSFWQFAWREVWLRIIVGTLVLSAALATLKFLRPQPADWYDIAVYGQAAV